MPPARLFYSLLWLKIKRSGYAFSVWFPLKLVVISRNRLVDLTSFGNDSWTGFSVVFGKRHNNFSTVLERGDIYKAYNSVTFLERDFLWCWVNDATIFRRFLNGVIHKVTEGGRNLCSQLVSSTPSTSVNEWQISFQDSSCWKTASSRHKRWQISKEETRGVLEVRAGSGTVTGRNPCVEAGRPAKAFGYHTSLGPGRSWFGIGNWSRRTWRDWRSWSSRRSWRDWRSRGGRDCSINSIFISSKVDWISEVSESNF